MSDNKSINTMVELTKTNRITMGVIAVLVILLLGFLFMKPAKYTFNTTLDKEVKDLKDIKTQMSPQSLAQAMLKKDASIVLVDVRSPFEFAKGHLPDAQNFYQVNLFDEASMTFFKNLKASNKTAILYGNNVSEANMPFMILKQMGIENIKVLTGGLKDFDSRNWKDIAALSTQFNDEKPIEISVAKTTETPTESAPATNAATPEKPKPVVKPAKAGGGDEGC